MAESRSYQARRRVKLLVALAIAAAMTLPLLFAFARTARAARDAQWSTDLGKAVRKGDAQTAARLLAARPSEAIITRDQMLSALSSGNEAVVGLLLDHGADPNSEVGPLQLAAGMGRVGMVRLLLQHGADPNLDLPGSGLALVSAAAKGNAEVVKALLDAHADPAKRDARSGLTALAQAAEAGQMDVVRLLLDRGCAWSKLNQTACLGDLPGLRSALAAGTPVDTQDEFGYQIGRAHV